MAGKFGQLYFSVRGSDTTLKAAYPLNIETAFTACYDIEQDTLLWLRRDSMILSSPLYFMERCQYFKNYKVGNSIIRIFATKKNDRTSSNGGFYNQPIDGVFFEKISCTDGSLEDFKTVVPKPALSSSTDFGISNVIYDSANKKFYFGCNDQNLYCLDINGNLQWKKSGYIPKKNFSSTSNESGARIYFGGNKLVYISEDIKIKAVDAISGNDLWTVSTQVNSSGSIYPELFVTNKYIFPCLKPRILDRLDIATGNISSLPYFTPSFDWSDFYPLDIFINDSTIGFQSIGKVYIEDTPDKPQGRNTGTLNMSTFSRYYSDYKENVFGLSSGCPTCGFTITNLNYSQEQVVWQRQFFYTPVPGEGTAEIYDFFRAGSSLFIIADFNINDNQVRPVNKLSYTAPQPLNKGNVLNAIEFHIQSGATIKTRKLLSMPNLQINTAYGFTFSY